MNSDERLGTTEADAYLQHYRVKWRNNPNDPAIKEELVEAYNNMAEIYNSMEEYQAPYQAVPQVAPFLQDKKDLHIMDVGAGTGTVTLELKKLLRHPPARVDALEPCEKMLEKVPPGTYDKIYMEYMEGLNSTTVPSGQYDLVIGIGVFAPGHMPIKALYEFSRFAKIGGLIVVALRDNIADGTWCKGYSDWYPTLHKLEADGYWKPVKTFAKYEYYKHATGSTFIYEKLKDF